MCLLTQPITIFHEFPMDGNVKNINREDCVQGISMNKINKETLARFSDNMKVMVATLEVLDRSTKGELSGEEAIKKLDLIKEEFYTPEVSSIYYKHR